MINRLRYNIEKLWQHRFFRFLVIGAVNTLFGYAVFALLIFLRLHYTLALFLGTVCGVLFNFKTVGHFVFENSDKKLIFKFFAVYGIVYLVNVSSFTLLGYVIENKYVIQLLLILPMALIGFFLNRTLVFKGGDRERGKQVREY